MAIIFETDFEADTKNVKWEGDVRTPFEGSEAALETSGETNKFLIQTEGDYEPYGMIIDDPTNPGNAVFEASGGRRVQTKLQGWFGTEGLSEQRWYLNADHNLLLGLDKRVYMWQEWKVRLNDPPTFRVMLRFLVDPDDGFGWDAHAETAASDPNSEEFWRYQNWNVEVPIETWFTTKAYFKSGDADTGRIVVTMTPDGGSEQVVHDIHDWTYSYHAVSLQDCQEWFPQKMYDGANSTSPIIDGEGGALKQYYDWWRFSVPGEDPTIGQEDPIPPGEKRKRGKRRRGGSLFMAA